MQSKIPIDCPKFQKQTDIKYGGIECEVTYYCIRQYKLLLCETDSLPTDRKWCGRNILNQTEQKPDFLSVTTEKICANYHGTLNSPSLMDICQQLTYRQPMPVLQIRCFRYSGGTTGFPVCPRCGITMEREYQRFCDRCGQRLDWRSFKKAKLVLYKQQKRLSTSIT